VIDTHAHLDACAEDAGALVEAAREAGVTRIVTIGREQAVELAGRLPGVWAAVGWHPHEAGEVADVYAVEPLLADPRVVAVGECGLDYYRNRASRDDQLRVFRAQVEIANRAGKPLVIHTREADDDTFRVLESATVAVVLHCFSSVGRLDDAGERGYYCSFAGNVTYPAAEDLRAAAGRVPGDRILAETDSPYLSPVPLRGRPNQPANVRHTLAVLAEARGEPASELEARIDRNASAVFGLA
jgi:TatD DNase family protein